MRIRPIRRLWHVLQRTWPFLLACFSERGLGSSEGRTLILGKLRRIFLSFFPPLARHLQKQNRLQGGCANCGASCRLLFQCPHWDESSNLCTVYEDRPSICRLFPITPADLRDRDLVARKHPCGFSFRSKPVEKLSPRVRKEPVPVGFKSE